MDTEAPVFIAATSELDRDKDRVDVASLRLENFLANPVLLANHDRDHPIGTWEVSVEGGQILASPRFASTARAQEWKTLVDEDVVKAVSIGFRPDPSSSSENDEGGLNYFGAELLEISLLSIPSNAHALRVKGISDDAASYVIKEAPMTIKTKTAAPAVTKNDPPPPEDEAKEEGDLAALTETVAALAARLDTIEAALAEVTKSEDEEKQDDSEEKADEPEDEEKEESSDEEKALDALAVLFG